VGMEDARAAVLIQSTPVDLDTAVLCFQLCRLYLQHVSPGTHVASHSRRLGALRNKLPLWPTWILRGFQVVEFAIK
jgi:hypothetical protein